MFELKPAALLSASLWNSGSLLRTWQSHTKRSQEARVWGAMWHELKASPVLFTYHLVLLHPQNLVRPNSVNPSSQGALRSHVGSADGPLSLYPTW